MIDDDLQEELKIFIQKHHFEIFNVIILCIYPFIFKVDPQLSEPQLSESSVI